MTQDDRDRKDTDHFGGGEDQDDKRTGRRTTKTGRTLTTLVGVRTRTTKGHDAGRQRQEGH